jgi:hypothetical protein
MQKLRFLRFALPIALVLGLVACDDDDDVTGSNRSLARVSVDAPDAARTGDEFEVQITAENIGLSNIRNGHVDINVPTPLAVVGVGTSAGTNATFSNGLSGGRVSWDLGTLDSNSQSRLIVRTVGILLPGQGSAQVTIEASMTGQSIDAGDAVAREEMTINP